MRTELGLVLKHITRCVEKVNAVNCFTKLPPLADEFYHEEYSYAVNEKMGGFLLNAQGSNKDNWFQGQGIKVGTMGIQPRESLCSIWKLQPQQQLQAG